MNLWEDCKRNNSTMNRSLMILLNALFLSVVTSSMDMKFGYHVIDGNAKYFENIETNLEGNTVKIHTPAHNDVMESYQIQDFRQGLQMKCLPSLKQCRLRDIDRKTAADAGQVTEGFIHSWNKGDNTINSDNEEVVKEMFYVNLDEVVDEKSLAGTLTEFHQDFKYPVYEEKKIPQDSEVLNITGSRVKRALTTFIGLECHGQPSKLVFGIDTGRSDNHLKICQIERYILTDCGNIHIYSPMVYQCICCPWVTSVATTGDCQCNRMGW
ncbi:uncharacterized protein [Mytilus edulis]|uniref:uncharacterized protein isoform X2 n=1 Tax=Mytilus edulis TaxID=6550 RepID=UPI0039F052BC